MHSSHPGHGDLLMLQQPFMSIPIHELPAFHSFVGYMAAE